MDIASAPYNCFFGIAWIHFYLAMANLSSAYASEEQVFASRSRNEQGITQMWSSCGRRKLGTTLRRVTGGLSSMPWQRSPKPTFGLAKGTLYCAITLQGKHASPTPPS